MLHYLFAIVFQLGMVGWLVLFIVWHKLKAFKHNYITTPVSPIHVGYHLEWQGCYSLRPKMIIRVSNFGEIKVCWPLTESLYDSYKRKHQLLRNAPINCGVERLLGAKKCLTLSLKYLAGQINRTIILGQRNPGSRTIILGRREYNFVLKIMFMAQVENKTTSMHAKAHEITYLLNTHILNMRW